MAGLAAVLLGANGANGQSTAAPTPNTITVPAIGLTPADVDKRASGQRARSPQIGMFHDFSFSDQLEASGIEFVHRPTLDGTSEYKMVHYDHGNGIAVADVDVDGAPDLYFVSQQGSNELWRNKGDGTFEDITSRSPVLGLADRISVAASFADIDNDGDADLYVTTVNMGNMLFENRGGGRFVDITERSGTGHVAHSSGAVFFDYDNDGLLDLFVTNVGQYTGSTRGEGDYFVGYRDAFSGHLLPERTEQSVLYRNLGKNRFADVTAKTQLADQSWSGDASFADLNGDGFLDLYVLNMQGDDHFWRNQGGTRFVDATATTFPKTPWGAMGVKFFDWDNDRDLDLFVTDMHSDMSISVSPANEHTKAFMTWDEHHLQGGGNNVFGNAFYRNDGDTMAEISDQVGAENYWPWGVSVGDLNADGYEDAFVAASMSYPFRYSENVVLLNARGKAFERVEYLLGVEPRAGGQNKKWFDIDCPPGPDTAEPALPSVEAMLTQCGFRKGKVAVHGAKGTRTAAIFDIDGDGDQDIVTGEFHDVPQVLVSNLSERKEINYIKIALEGSESNRDGLGATVVVKAGDDTFYRQHDGKLGYLGQSSHAIFVGLGDNAAVSSITVNWPSGSTQTLSTGLKTNSTVTIKEALIVER